MHALCSNPMVSNNFAKLCFTQIHLMVVHMFHFWNFSSPRDYFLSLYIWMYSVYRFIQTSYFWFIQTVILLVYLDHHTSGSCRIFIPLVHLDFFIILVHLDRHTSGTSRVFILLVHLEFSYLWFVQILFVNLVHLKIHHTFGYRSMKTLVEPDASQMSRRTRSMNRSLDEVKV